jgi:hypothetical protein
MPDPLYLTFGDCLDMSPQLFDAYVPTRILGTSVIPTDLLMFEGAKVPGAQVLVLLREVVEVDTLGVVVAAMDMSANMNIRRLLEASPRLVRKVNLEAKEAAERVHQEIAGCLHRST